MAAAPSPLASTLPLPTTRFDDRAIAVKAMCHPRTVRSAYEGRVSPLSLSAIAKAAVELGFAPPPPRTNANRVA